MLKKSYMETFTRFMKSDRLGLMALLPQIIRKFEGSRSFYQKEDNIKWQEK